MTTIDRILVASLALGVWMLVALQITTVHPSHAQQAEPAEETVSQGPQNPAGIHASEIVGLSAFVQQTVREQQFRPQSMPGLEQYVRSIVRNCRINGYVSGNRLSGTSISC